MSGQREEVEMQRPSFTLSVWFPSAGLKVGLIVKTAAPVFHDKEHLRIIGPLTD